MAKICINCGRKITFMMDQFSMVHTRETFCADCMRDAKKMLEPIKILVNRDRLPEVKEEFKQFLSHSDYSDEIRQLIRTEFEQISGEFANDSVYQVKRFIASFEESCEAIKNIGIYLTGETVQCNPPVRIRYSNMYIILEDAVKTIPQAAYCRGQVKTASLQT